MRAKTDNRIRKFSLRLLFALVTFLAVAIGVFTNFYNRFREEAEAMQSLSSNTGIQVFEIQPTQRVASYFEDWARCLMGFDSIPNALRADIKDEHDLRFVNELQCVPAIRELTISDCQMWDLRWFKNNPSLQVLRTYRCQFENLEGLSQLVRLKTLDLERCSGLDSFKGLEKAPKGLKSLRITVDARRAPVTDQKTFAALRSIEDLELGKVSTDDLTWLSNCLKLQRLNIEDASSLRSLNGIEQLQQLQTLEILCANHIDSLQPLSALTELRSIQIPFDPERDFSSLRELRKLQRVIAPASELESLAGIERLHDLRELSLSRVSKLKNLSELESLSGLESLTLSDGAADLNLGAIGRMKNLKKLMLQSCSSLLSPEFLRECSSLESLRLLFCNELTDIQALSRIPSLRFVEIGKCRNVTKSEIDALQVQCPLIGFKFK